MSEKVRQVGTAAKNPWPSDFICDDCGKRRRNRFRNRCAKCPLAVCDFCAVKHGPNQHAVPDSTYSAPLPTADRGHALRPEGRSV